MGVPDDRIDEAIGKLREMALVKIDERTGRRLIVPINKKTAATMKEWTRNWCLSDNDCPIPE